MRAQRAGLIGVLLSLAGIGLCAWLTFIHIALLRGELLGGAACGSAGTLFNCHAVTAGSFGSIFGVPLSLWGLVGYLATLGLAFIAWQFSDWSGRALAALAGMAIIFFAIDLVLLTVMLTQIRYLCALCLASYLVNLLLAVTAKHGLAQSWPAVLRQIPPSLMAWRPQPRVAVVWIVWGMVLTGSAGALAVNAATTFAAQGDPAALRKQISQFVSHQQRVTVNVAGDPILGAPNGPIQIVEFSDFLCPVCQRASKLNPVLLAGHRREASFVFKHFPLDTTCNSTIGRMVHAGACQLAAATECAHEQGKFWALHDRIFVEGAKYRPENLERDVSALGLDVAAWRACLDSGRGIEAVKRDIEEAVRLGLNSTPTYFLNGIRNTGLFTPVTFEAFLDVLRHPDRATPR